MLLDWLIKKFQGCSWRFQNYYWDKFVPQALVNLGVSFDSCKFYGMPIISKVPDTTITLGRKVVLCSVSTHTALGVNHPVILRTMNQGAQIHIGDSTGLSGTTVCAMKSVRIGSNCLIGANVTIADTNFHSLNPDNRRFNTNLNEIDSLPIVIGDNVFIGASSMILKGVHIGENSVIGAGSIVTSDIPANVIAAGNPAKVVRELG